MERSLQSPLDNPVWSALTTVQSHLGTRGEFAARYHPDVAPFAGLASGTADAFENLGQLMASGDQVLALSSDPLPPLAHLQAEHRFDVLQMVDAGDPGKVSEDGVARLTASDAQDMLALARKTQPGPFGTRTREMGYYIGIRDGNRLAAMAGERMRCARFAEISAVCVVDGYRGQGIASRLMNILRHRMREQGEVPFLHVRDDNATAIALYERLGFETRKRFRLYQITAGERPT